jgi:hypothetical protein
LRTIFISIRVKFTAATVLAAVALISPSLRAGTILYNSRVTYLGALTSSLTDDFENPGYTSSPMSDAVMTAVLNQTRFHTTGFADKNLVFLNGGGGHVYCAGCNGSFLLTFTQTSLGNANGVFGAGVDIDGNAGGPFYVASVTFGDNSSMDFALPQGGAQATPIGFWGITSTLEIKSIHFGTANGSATTGGLFEIDNLTIGSQVPEPGSLALTSAALLGLGWVRRNLKAHS